MIDKMAMRTFPVKRSVRQCCITSVDLVAALVHNNVGPSFAMAVRAVLDHLTRHASENRLAKILMVDSGAAGNFTITKSVLSFS